MKANIHPKWYPEAVVTCACGNTFTTGGTLPKIHVEICSNCHPFYTGQMKFVDTAGRVDKFQSKQKVASNAYKSKKERRFLKKKKKMEEELARPESLEEIRKAG